VSPEDLKYTAEHEWLRVEGDQAVIGVTDFAQDEPGASIGELESTKSVADLYAPVAGVVAERNEALEQNPELVNSDPYGDGWLIKVTLADPSAVDGLMDAAAYEQLTASP
jgi:glycine cleavage system H protein